jgi:hypothetical protein
MTDEEALRLHPGQRVEAYMIKRGTGGAAWWPAVVVEVDDWRSASNWRSVVVSVRPLGVTPKGHRYAERWIRSRQISIPWAKDNLPANVYADFLDEKGEHQAADLLREAFPLGPPEG